MSNLSDDLMKNMIEGALFSSQVPMDEKAILKLFGEDNPPSIGEIRQILSALQAEYQDRGIELKEVASGYRFQVAEKVMPHLSTMWSEKPQRFSRAFLETLALIAYRQPITRGEIEDIRGVTVSSQIIRTLLEFEWIKIVGHKDLPGRPALLATTRQFLDHFNLKGLDELPTLAQIRDLAEVERDLEKRLESEQTAAPIEESEEESVGIEEVKSDEAESEFPEEYADSTTN
jgi:segregation and condensation protein B